MRTSADYAKEEHNITKVSDGLWRRISSEMGVKDITFLRHKESFRRPRPRENGPQARHAAWRIGCFLLDLYVEWFSSYLCCTIIVMKEPEQASSKINADMLICLTITQQLIAIRRLIASRFDLQAKH